MRVIDTAGYHDYYDVMMAHDQDRKVVYQRDRREIWFERHNQTPLCLPQLSYKRDCQAYYEKSVLIGWCGQVFSAMYDPICSDWTRDSYSINTFYSVEAINKAIAEEEEKQGGLVPARRRDFSWWKSQDGENYKRKLHLWFSKGEVTHSLPNEPEGDWRRDKRFTDLFTTHNAPIWVLRLDGPHHMSLVINPVLKGFGFQVVKDVHTAWQELSAYVGGVLTNPAGIEPRPMDDVLKRDLHGFDDQSFKKAPTKAEKREKRRKR